MSIKAEYISPKTQFLHSLKLQIEMQNSRFSIYLGGEISGKLNELQHLNQFNQPIKIKKALDLDQMLGITLKILNKKNRVCIFIQEGDSISSNYS